MRWLSQLHLFCPLLIGKRHVYFVNFFTDQSTNCFGIIMLSSFCGINHRCQWSTLEQENKAPQMPICLMNLIEPKRRWADPSEAKLYVCSIPNIEIYLAVVDWSQTHKLVSIIPFNNNVLIWFIGSKWASVRSIYRLINTQYRRLG